MTGHVLLDADSVLQSVAGGWAERWVTFADSEDNVVCVVRSEAERAGATAGSAPGSPG